MSNAANVDSVDALKVFRAALIKFAEESSVALGDAEAEMQRVLGWLETEQLKHWENQIRKRKEELSRALEALRMKTNFKDATGKKPSAVEEEKMVQLCRRRVEEAEQKFNVTRMHARKLLKEIQLYKGGAQRFATALASQVPVAAARLGTMIEQIEAYARLSAPSSGSVAGGGSSAGGSMGLAGGAGGVAENPWQAIRVNTPSAEARAAVADGAIGEAPWAVPSLGEQDRQALASIPGDRATIDPETRVVISAGVQDKARVYLERSTPAFAGDSGWFLGAADGSATEFQSVRVTELLLMRPDLADALTLPPGTLVAVDGGGVVAVLDSKGQEARPPAGVEAVPTESPAAITPASH